LLLTLGSLGCRSAQVQGEASMPVDVVFAGADSQFTFRLRRVIEDLLLDFARNPSDEAPLYDAAQDLTEHYWGLGFPDARVDYRVARAARPTVTFDVHEGPRVTVTHMELAGNHAVDDDQLLPLWPRTRSGLLATGDPYFVQEELLVFKAAMRALYEQRGFLAAVIAGPDVGRSAGGTTARVRFDIGEGPRYRVASVTIAATLPLEAPALGLDALLASDFDRDALEALRQRARVQLEQRGYPSPRVELRLTRDAATTTVAVALYGATGPRARIAGVSIEGLERTRRFVVERCLRFAEGEWYDGSKVEATTREIYLTGLFRRVEVQRRPRDAAGTELTLAVVVEEIEARDLDLLAGYGSYESLRGGVVFTDRNLFGRGHRASLGLRASMKSQALSGSWTVPNALGSGTALTTTGYLRERQEPAYDDVSRGADVALARDLFGRLRGRIGYELQSRNARIRDESARGTAPDAFEIGSVFAELVLDARDAPLYPTRGHRESLKLERARDFLGGDIELDRVTWSVAGFWPWTEDVVLGAAVRGGIAWSDELLPVQERFFNGGESSVRSFEEAELGPLSAAGIPQGGAFFNTLGFELRFPLVRALHGAVFADAGNVGTDADAFGWSDLRYGVGGGLRLVLPIGPIRLDGAVNPDRRPGEESWVVHLSVGLPF
jgi:outer membrane protein assembly complex protein YaeT